MIKPDASGNATRWQGYVAREGLGITRTKNQINAANPVNGNSHQACPERTCLERSRKSRRGQRNPRPDLMGLPVLGQNIDSSLLFRTDIAITSPAGVQFQHNMTSLLKFAD